MRTSAGPSSISGLEEIWILTYNDDSLRLLDSMEKVSLSASGVRVSSTVGDKIFAAVGNFKLDSLEYSDIVSWDGLESIACKLSEENPEKAVISGMCRGMAGESHYLELTPLLSKIRIKGLRYDFSARPYRNCKLEGIKVYLTNVNGIFPLFAESASTSREIINYGGLDVAQCKAMSHPEMVLNEKGEPCTLYCYPCRMVEGNMLGQCNTKLVVEGKIEGTTYYYPIDLGKLNLERGRSYSFDILLTRTGSLDPETTVDIETASLILERDEWEEYGNEVIAY